MSGGIPTRLHAQYLPQGKEKLLLRDILCLKRRSCLPQRRTGKLKKTLSLLWKISLHSSGIQELKNS